MSGLGERLRGAAWYFGIGSAAEAERRRLALDEEREGRSWWREALVFVGGTAAFEILRHTVGFAHAIADLAVVIAILYVAGFATRFVGRWRASERPPVD
jgi:hypothetical protein